MNREAIESLNSATKYPPIPTYHELGPHGVLSNRVAVDFGDRRDLIWTEKVSGANARVIVHPTGMDWFLGSREHILHARGDRIWDPDQNIAETLHGLAPRLQPEGQYDVWTVYYLEVYGGAVGGDARQYAGRGTAGFRLFDATVVPCRVAEQSTAHASVWRRSVGPRFLPESELLALAERLAVPVAPRLRADAGAPPANPGACLQFLRDAFAPAPGLPARTRCALDDRALGRPEGVVVRTPNRALVAKLRFQDYERHARAQERPKTAAGEPAARG